MGLNLRGYTLDTCLDTAMVLGSMMKIMICSLLMLTR